MSPLRTYRWYFVSLIVIVIDQITKQMAEAWLIFHEPVPVFPSFGWLLTYNTGAAFSFLREAGGWQRWFFLVFGLSMSAFLALWLYRLTSDQKWLAAALALILGGAIGNMIDRALLGHVIDFIHFYYAHWHFPAFNIADAAITIGAALLIGENFHTHTENPPKS